MLPESSAWFETRQELRALVPQQLIGRSRDGLACQPGLGKAPGPLLDVCQWHGGCVHFFPVCGGDRRRWRCLERLTGEEKTFHLPNPGGQRPRDLAQPVPGNSGGPAIP